MKRLRFMAALCAVFLMAISFTTVAYAGGGEETTQEVEETTQAEEIPEPVSAPNPFTPEGTGTVIDNVTDEEGKEFFTIMTPDENVFYLVIDKQRATENVYFLGAVTEHDLLSLAQKSEEPATTPSVVEPMPEPTPEPTPEPEPKTDGMGKMFLIVLVVLAGGSAAYYFKVYRPKQGQAVSTDDEYEDYEEDSYDEQEDGGSSWYEDEGETGTGNEDGEL